jgi:short-subunit dehydrogenase
MIQLVLPTMRQQNSGKIINISSIAGKIWVPFGGWYHSSKFAVEGLSDCLRNELRSFGIDIVLIEPGLIKSEWSDTAVDNLMETSGQGPYKELADKQAEYFKKEYGEEGMAVEPEVIADVVLKATKADKPKTRYAAPAHAKLFLFLRWLLPDKLYDWVISKLVGLPKNLK